MLDGGLFCIVVFSVDILRSIVKMNYSNDVKIEEVLEYLSEWRTNKEVQKKFKLSSISCSHLLRWLVRGRFVNMISGMELEQKDGRLWFYQTKKHQKD